MRWALFGEEPSVTVKLLIEKSCERILVPRPGFEPGARARKASIRRINLNTLWSHYKEQYLSWLSNKVATEDTKHRYTTALEKFFGKYKILSYEDLQTVLTELNYKRHICKALRSFAKFLKNIGAITRDEYLDLKEIIWLKPTQPRKTNVSDKQIQAALKYYQDKAPTLALVYKLLVFSGQRLRTIVEMLNEFKREKLILPKEYPTIAKYPLYKQMGTKKSFYVYLPRDLALSLERLSLNYNTVKNRMRIRIRAVRETDASINFSAAAVREWFATFLARQGVPMEVINFIQGRAERGVLEKHYLNLEILADEWYSAVLPQLLNVLEG
ncbi:integrase [Pyrococcus kukulkanii]|uniref:integrase n=1 Tax=Pyrococcus kukulkanii TaxID=1609559 RepID=UPI00356B352F